MPDEISHLIWTHLLLKHPKVKACRDFQTAKGVTAAYFFTILPDLANAVIILAGLWIMLSNNLPFVFGPDALKHPQVYAAFRGPLRNVYYVLHSYVTLAVLVVASYLLLGRVYWPLVLGMGLAITLDIPTHRDFTALKPFYPLLDVKVNGLIHWGSWTFYAVEALAVAAYTAWIFRRPR